MTARQPSVPNLIPVGRSISSGIWWCCLLGFEQFERRSMLPCARAGGHSTVARNPRSGNHHRSVAAHERHYVLAARPLVRIAHGGGGSLAAPNSLEGIERSLAFGVDMIEIDVRCTRDGVLVLSHDDGPGGSAISASSLDELRRAHADVATLDDAFALVDGKAVLNLDVKDAASIKCIGSAVRARSAIDHCVVSCLKRSWLLALADLEPSIPTFLSYPADRGGASPKPWLEP